MTQKAPETFWTFFDIAAAAAAIIFTDFFVKCDTSRENTVVMFIKK